MAIGSTTFGGITTGVSDIFAGFGDEAKASFDLSEQQEYELAGKLATQNQQFTEMSTAIQEAQQQREITQAMGKTTAQIAGAALSVPFGALFGSGGSPEGGAVAGGAAGGISAP